MFICSDCIKDYDNFSILKSNGKCELCDKESTCHDIPSKFLVKNQMAQKREHSERKKLLDSGKAYIHPDNMKFTLIDKKIKSEVI